MAGSTAGSNPTNAATEQLGIQDWVKGLAAIPERDFSLAAVQNYILHHAVRPATLDKYCYFSKGSYTRNLIFKNDVFECLTVCWEIGQHSRVHNHRDQNCWMAVPIGRLRVQNYRVEHRDASRGTCKILPTDVYEMDATHPAYVNPLEPVHEVINANDFNQRAVSIHVYSKPFDTCEVYLRDAGTYSDVPLFYTSEYGQLNSAERL
jgi:cysteine dioxygenase